MAKTTRHFSRRSFLATSLAGAAALSTLEAAQAGGAESRQATGVKIGEVTDTAAVVWTRLTAAAAPNARGKAFPRGKVVTLPQDTRVADLQNACPGAPGRIRLRYGTDESLKDARATEWLDAVAKNDFIRQFRLTGLQPGTVYHYAAETTGPGGKPAHAPLRGRFETAPAPDRYADITFTVMSCSGYKDLDHADGYHVCAAMAKLRPNFFVHTGDNVYYDNDDLLANTVALARHHWHRMHALPRHVAFHRVTPGCWMKDDHDTLANDCWPGRNVKAMLPLTFAEGLAIFREQVPMGERTYRTFRWGRGVQVWLVL
jgi:alkaline phosphatase D